MGKLILCNGNLAEQPYYVKLTDTELYSIEELCYYIYNNIELITEEFFDDTLVHWIHTVLKLEERADKLLKLLEAKAGLKDYVVCVLCSADYYTEAEIKQLLVIMDEWGNLTPIERKKKKADNYIKYRQYTEAVMEYEMILSSSEAAALDSVQYGDLIHNLALAQIYTIGLTGAAKVFKQAYERNHNKESLKQYICTLILSKQEEILNQEVSNYGISKEYLEQINNELDSFYQEAETSSGYEVIENLMEYKDAGQIVPFYQMAGDLINGWKQEFRRENS
ncbi:hypothetical protein [Anaerocolumna sp. MB42-C2]|uniref:hypothetical protein n=1 Tax=Anaerocolumna sp. MB42-C2 TaxID=3070997 RepID=UPI0027DFCED4|nr:hypothetical protein [Anaerocolumna sp. MB42-C2]WMJ86323.1 hypothetical protein RBU59_20085 [Anaerocolumna sp. MB42-C2]